MRRRLQAVPGVVRAVFAIAFVLGTTWALLTPAFQVPDEPGHFAYAQYFAENGKLPTAGRNSYSGEQASVMLADLTVDIIGHPYMRAPGSNNVDDSKTKGKADGGGPTGASGQPPLYYALEAIPYRLFAWAPLPTRLLAMRMLSVLMFALTAAVASLVAAELLPGRKWAMLLGGGVIALSPTMGSIAGGVTPDNLLDLLAGLIVLFGIRGMRRPSRRAAILVAALTGAGVVTKITFAALAPGAIAIVLVILWRLGRAEGRGAALRAAVPALAAGLVLPVIYAIWTEAIGRGLLGASASTPTLPSADVVQLSLRGRLAYIWQLYLPRLPWQDVQFPKGYPLVDSWIHGYVGRYGWLDYAAPGWMRALGRDVFIVLGLMFVGAAVQFRTALWKWKTEIAALALLPIGLAYVVGAAGYQYSETTGFSFEQVRYLFPVATLMIGALLIACHVLGRRRAPVIAAVVLGVLVLHALSGLLLTAGRYYG